MYAPKVRMTGQEGYTIMEMLIVITIIGILAAMAIPAYNDYIKRANDAETLHDLQKTAEAWEICRNNNCEVAIEPQDAGQSATQDTVVACRMCQDPMNDGVKYVMSSEFTTMNIFNGGMNPDQYNIMAYNQKGTKTFCWYNPPGDLDTIPGLGAMCPNMW